MVRIIELRIFCIAIMSHVVEPNHLEFQYVLYDIFLEFLMFAVPSIFCAKVVNVSTRNQVTSITVIETDSRLKLESVYSIRRNFLSRKKWKWRERNETLAGHDHKAEADHCAVASLEARVKDTFTLIDDK